jgi:hypothetical protein
MRMRRDSIARRVIHSADGGEPHNSARDTVLVQSSLGRIETAPISPPRASSHARAEAAIAPAIRRSAGLVMCHHRRFRSSASHVRLLGHAELPMRFRFPSGTPRMAPRVASAGLLLVPCVVRPRASARGERHARDLRSAGRAGDRPGRPVPRVAGRSHPDRAAWPGWPARRSQDSRPVRV